MVGALVKTGVIGELAGAATDATGGDALLAVMPILGVSWPERPSRPHRTIA
jgi:hypothetical protein